MKRSEQLKISRGQKIESMNSIVTAASENGTARSLTTDEQKNFDALEVEVRSLDSQITQAEALEARQAPDSTEPQHQRNGNGPQIMKRSAPYSAAKAMREFLRGDIAGLTGIEAEQHQEISQRAIKDSEGLLIPMPNMYNRAQTTATNADSIDIKIDPNISIIGSKSIYQQMGLKTIEGLTGSFKLGKMNPVVGGKKGETVSATVGANVPTFVTASPERYPITESFSRELLFQENPAVQLSILNDMIAGCDRAITKEVFDKAYAAATELAGTTAITYDNFVELMGAVEKEGGAFAMSRTNFYKTMKTKVDEGSGFFLGSLLSGDTGVGKTHMGVNAFYSTLFAPAENRILYGAWDHMWLGFWGALEILRNPYTGQKEGLIEVTVNRFANVQCQNPAAFKKSAVIV